MKKYRLFYFMCILLGMAVGFTSCSDDDDEASVESLIGTWESIYSEGYDIWNGEKETWDGEPEDPLRLTFREDGTYRGEEFYNGKWHLGVSRTYVLKGNKLFYYDEEEEESGSATIISLTKDKLVIEESFEDEYEEYYEKITFKRIK